MGGFKVFEQFVASYDATGVVVEVEAGDAGGDGSSGVEFGHDLVHVFGVFVDAVFGNRGIGEWTYLDNGDGVVVVVMGWRDEMR